MSTYYPGVLTNPGTNRVWLYDVHTMCYFLVNISFDANVNIFVQATKEMQLQTYNDSNEKLERRVVRCSPRKLRKVR